MAGLVMGMTWLRLPPVGDGIRLEPGPRNAVRGLFAPWHVALLGSGTQALAATLLALKAASPDRDEVVFAAYNCPALVSATVYAGCRPVLVDYTAARPWLDLNQLASRLSTRTLAVIAVDFLGIPERYAALRTLCGRVGCSLVQDSAQAFPSRAGERMWQGDAVVLSFGRGKPVSLLTGGAVLSRERDLCERIARSADVARGTFPRLRWQVAAYNLLRQPWLYGLPAALPWLHLGETRFVPLQTIHTMPADLQSFLVAAVRAFRRARHPQRLYPSFLTGHRLLDLPAACGHRHDERLSRYPVLAADAAMAGRLVRDLADLGASGLYGVPLPEVAGVAVHLDGQDTFPRAADFAARLVTFPNHDGVRPHHLAHMAARLRAEEQERSLAEVRV